MSQSVRIHAGVVLWSSFLAGAVASVVFFAAVDPALLRDAGPRVFDGLDREAGYALGFLFLWAVGAVASALAVFLVRTARAESGGNASGDGP